MENEKMGIKVLSLFDGISCGMVALERVGIPVETYYASEIDKYAMKISKKNYPNIIQLGDIRNITEEVLDSIMPIDIIIGGSPARGNGRRHDGRTRLRRIIDGVAVRQLQDRRCDLSAVGRRDKADATQHERLRVTGHCPPRVIPNNIQRGLPAVRTRYQQFHLDRSRPSLQPDARLHRSAGGRIIPQRSQGDDGQRRLATDCQCISTDGYRPDVGGIAIGDGDRFELGLERLERVNRGGHRITTSTNRLLVVVT